MSDAGFALFALLERLLLAGGMKHFGRPAILRGGHPLERPGRPAARVYPIPRPAPVLRPRMCRVRSEGRSGSCTDTEPCRARDHKWRPGRQRPRRPETGRSPRLKGGEVSLRQKVRCGHNSGLLSEPQRTSRRAVCASLHVGSHADRRGSCWVCTSFLTHDL